MTRTVKRTLIIIFFCVLFCATVTLGVFGFIGNFDVNEFGEFYQSPLTAIQKSGAFTDSVKSIYKVKLDEDVEGLTADSIVKAIQTRLNKAYGYYGSKVEYDSESNSVSIQIPKSDNENTQVKPSEKSIMENVIINGKVEILSTAYSSSASYSADSVLLTQEHFRRASVRSYISQGTTLYICRVKLTKEGRQLAKDELETSSPYICALDEAVNTWVYWTGNDLQITYAYTDVATSEEYARAMASYISSGSLQATLTQEGVTETIENHYGWIFLVVFGALVLASFVYFAVRFKGLSIPVILTQALAVLVFMFFGALVHLEIFNVAMAIGVILAYAFMTFFSAVALEKLNRLLSEGKNYSVARYHTFTFGEKESRKDNFISLIAHGALLVLGIILWVIPTVVTAPLGNALVYGAVLSFVVTFCLNRLFALMLSPFYEDNVKGRK